MSYLMIIDDDEDFALAAAKVLRNAGHEVDIELDPESGVARMKEKRPDLLILDVMFAENISGGFELARRIRQSDENLHDVRVLMLTAINTKYPLGFSKNDIDDSWLPVDDFMEKPMDLGELESKVSEMLRRGGSGTDAKDGEAQ